MRVSFSLLHILLVVEQENGDAMRALFVSLLAFRHLSVQRRRCTGERKAQHRGKKKMSTTARTHKENKRAHNAHGEERRVCPLLLLLLLPRR